MNIANGVPFKIANKVPFNIDYDVPKVKLQVNQSPKPHLNTCS